MSSRSQPIAIRESAPATKKDCHGGCNAQLASTAQPEEEKEDVEAEDKSPLMIIVDCCATIVIRLDDIDVIN